MGSSATTKLRAARLVVLAVVAVVFLASAGVARAARPAPASGGGEAAAGGYLVMYPAVVERARETVAMLLARLPAGPSPRGPGH
ncbi:hypothetical protein ACP70R_044985 [Stipagrostis hirtigluma subsp. patula]